MGLLSDFGACVSEGLVTAAVESHESNASLSLTTKTRLLSQITPAFFLSVYITRSVSCLHSYNVLLTKVWLASLQVVCLSCALTPPLPAPLEKSVTHTCIRHSKFCEQIWVRRKPKIDCPGQWKPSLVNAAVGLMRGPSPSLDGQTKTHYYDGS